MPAVVTYIIWQTFHFADSQVQIMFQFSSMWWKPGRPRAMMRLLGGHVHNGVLFIYIGVPTIRRHNRFRNNYTMIYHSYHNTQRIDFEMYMIAWTNSLDTTFNNAKPNQSINLIWHLFKLFNFTLNAFANSHIALLLYLPCFRPGIMFVNDNWRDESWIRPPRSPESSDCRWYMTPHPEPKQQKTPFSFTSAFENLLPNCHTKGFYFDLPQEHSWDPKMPLTPWRIGSKICTQPQMNCPLLHCMSGHSLKLNYNRNSKTCRLLRLWIPILLRRHCGRSQPGPWLNTYNHISKNVAQLNICQRVGVMEYWLFSINLEQKDTQHRNYVPSRCWNRLPRHCWESWADIFLLMYLTACAGYLNSPIWAAVALRTPLAGWEITAVESEHFLN